jgi:hypothetical protein
MTPVLAFLESTMWSRTIPVEPGMYWFYGFRSNFAKGHTTKDLMVVRVRKISNGVVYIGEGSIWSDREMDGHWMPLPEPELPTE